MTLCLCKKLIVIPYIVRLSRGLFHPFFCFHFSIHVIRIPNDCFIHSLCNPYLNNLLMFLADLQGFTRGRAFRARGGRWWWSCFCFNWRMAGVLCKIWSKKATGYCESFLCLFLYINTQNRYKIAACTYVIHWVCVCGLACAHVCTLSPCWS